jgi:hypothetical protein
MPLQGATSGRCDADEAGRMPVAIPASNRVVLD